MYFLLGVLAVFQSIFVPGALLCRALRITRSWDEFVSFSFALSLVINYLLILTLTFFSLYSKMTMLALLTLELPLAAYFFFIRPPRVPSGVAIVPSLERSLRSLLNGPLSFVLGRLLLQTLTVAACFSAINSLDTVFPAGDAVVSWNKWAIEWSEGRFATNTMHYPQLLPIILSLPYILMGTNEIQSFSVAIYLAFVPMTLLILSISYIRGFRVVSLVVALYVFFKLGNINQYYVGCADVPVTCLIIFSICFLLFASQSENTEKNVYRHLIIGGIMAAGAAVTKQSGIYWYFIYWLAVFSYLHNDLISKATLHTKILLIAMLAILFVIIVPWQSYLVYSIYFNNGSSEVSDALGLAHQGRSIAKRILWSAGKFPLYYCLALFAVPALWLPRFRVLSAAGILYTIIWGALLSYDVRNVQPAVPLLLASIAGVLSYVLMNNDCTFIVYAKKVAEHLWRIFTKNILCFVCLTIAILLGILSLVFNDAMLLKAQKSRQSIIKDISINKKMSTGINREGHGVIITDLPLLPCLPGFNKENLRFVPLKQLDLSFNQESLLHTLQQGDVDYILTHEGSASVVKNFLDRVPAYRGWRKIDWECGYELYKLEKARL